MAGGPCQTWPPPRVTPFQCQTPLVRVPCSAACKSFTCPGLLLTTRHYSRWGSGVGVGVPHQPPTPWTHPPDPLPTPYKSGPSFFRAFGQSKVSSGPLGTNQSRPKIFFHSAYSASKNSVPLGAGGLPRLFTRQGATARVGPTQVSGHRPHHDGWGLWSGAHGTRRNHEGAHNAHMHHGGSHTWQHGEAGGGRPGRHAGGRVEQLGLTHTEARRDMWWTTRTWRGVGSNNRKTTPAAASIAPVCQLLGSANTETTP